ncbi:MAG: hypothetical protein CM15mP21_6560 [Hyphomicrobiales bacterium]|nr:MAG: hypothetical protein CM15mP21_6560 [Hyphomicrobiales bacterium]
MAMCRPRKTVRMMHLLVLFRSIPFYSPVRRVSYNVENTREGQVLDYDKLTLDIETNGTVTPEDALALSARILQDQLQTFINFEEPEVRVKETSAIEEAGFSAALLKKSTSWNCQSARPTA